MNACNLLVYGASQVIPSFFRILKPNLMYSPLVSLSSIVQYSRAILGMDKNLCTDTAGNSFTRMPNSSVYIHIDRRKVYINIRTHVPDKLLQIKSETRTVQATNDHNKLKIDIGVLEDTRIHTLHGILRVQSCFRGYQDRCHCKELWRGITSLQSFIRGGKSRKEFATLPQRHKVVVIIQKHVKTIYQSKRMKDTIDAALVIQSFVDG